MATQKPPFEQNGVVFGVLGRRYIDRQVDPPIYVDDEIPSLSVQIVPRARRFFSLAAQGTLEASYYITGSRREFIPGTYGLRVTRLSLNPGSYTSNLTSKTWHIRHSRDGTYDVIQFAQGGAHVLIQGDPFRPIYAFGPGTVLFGFDQAAGSFTRAQLIEGFVSAQRPDQT